MYHHIKCNNLSCLTPLKSFPTSTVCGHAFCQPCTTILKKTQTCIACSTPITLKDIFVTDLEKIPSLILFPPEIVIETARRAINFWTYQCYEEFAIKDIKQENAVKDHQADKENLICEINKLRGEISFLSDKVTRLENELDRERAIVLEMDEKLGKKEIELSGAIGLCEKLKFNLRSKGHGYDK